MREPDGMGKSRRYVTFDLQRIGREGEGGRPYGLISIIRVGKTILVDARVRESTVGMEEARQEMGLLRRVTPKRRRMSLRRRTCTAGRESTLHTSAQDAGYLCCEMNVAVVVTSDADVARRSLSVVVGEEGGLPIGEAGGVVVRKESWFWG